MNRYTEEMKLWLFDVAHGNLNNDEIVKGFVKHYILNGESVGKVIDDIVFHTNYSQEGILKARDSIKYALEQFVKG